MLPASTRRCSDSSQTCRTTALPPSVWTDPAMVPGAEDPSLVQDASLPTTVSGYFQAGGTELNVNTLTGASWYVLNTAANALPTDGRWLVAQITTAGDLSGTLNAQIFPLGRGCQIRSSSLGTSLAVRSSFLAMVNLTSAAFATVLALPRVLAIAMARRLRCARDCDGNCICGRGRRRHL